MLSSTTDLVMFDLFDCGLFSKFQLVNEMRRFEKPFSFIYGDQDWVDSMGAEVLVTEKTQGLYTD